MNDWYMLTVVGADRAGIVARLSEALFGGGCHLGEASMMRLGANFTIMLMVRGASGERLEEIIAPVATELGLRWHVDHIEAHLHAHREPDVRITVAGADRAGIVAQVTGRLAQAGLHILDLESDVAGSEESPLYIMVLEGKAEGGREAVAAAVADLQDQGVDVALHDIDVVMG